MHAKGKGEGKTYPMTIQKTNQAIVIAIGLHDAQAGQISLAVARIADYLDDAGYWGALRSKNGSSPKKNLAQKRPQMETLHEPKNPSRIHIHTQPKSSLDKFKVEKGLYCHHYHHLF